VGPEGSALDFVIFAVLLLLFDRVYRARHGDSSVVRSGEA
jgi:hypothetical protein